jgi:hypothetical protein
MKMLSKSRSFTVPQSGRSDASVKGLFLFQDVNLFDIPTNNLGLQSRLNNPLYDNYHIAANFAMVVISMLFLLYAFQIYNKIQLGETKLVPIITRFFLGLVVFLASLSFLNSFSQKQDYNNNSVQNLNRPKLTK